MDWFAERGKIENDINVFETLAREDHTLNETEFHSFTTASATEQSGKSGDARDSSTQTNVEEIVSGVGEVEEVETVVEKSGEGEIADEDEGVLPREVEDANEAGVLIKNVETPRKKAGVLDEKMETPGKSGGEVLEGVDEAPENLTLVLSEDDTGGDAAGGDARAELEQMVSNSDITLREETDGSDLGLDDNVVASTPMVVVKKETVVEVTGGESVAFGLVNKILFEVNAPEQGGCEGENATSAGVANDEVDDIEVGEVRRDGDIAGLELSRLSGTHIEEVGDASDESWLLTGMDTESVGDISSEESVEERRRSVEGVTLARRLRMRSVNKYNSWLTRLNKESSVSEMSSESVEDVSLAGRLRMPSGNKDKKSGPRTDMDMEAVGGKVRQSVKGATSAAGRLRVQSVHKDNSWEVVEGAATRFSTELYCLKFAENDTPIWIIFLR